MNLYPVIQILADGHLHSGQELAQALGVSRTAVWKQLQELESGYGLKVQAVRGRGYQLSQPLDLLDADRVSQWLDRSAGSALNDNGAGAGIHQQRVDASSSIPVRLFSLYSRVADCR